MDHNTSNLSPQGKNPFSPENHEHLSAQRARELNEQYLPRPLPLQREIAQPKGFPFEALGSVLGAAAKRIHEIVKAPDAICGQSVLAAAALVTQGHADVYIDGRVHPLSLFMLTVAESGDRKSAVDSIILDSVRDFEKMLVKTAEEDKRRYKNKLDMWKKQREAILRNSETEKIEMQLNQQEREPIAPLEPHILLEEPSYEGLVKLFAIGQPSMGLFSDEGGRMFGGYAMGKDNMLKTACGLSSLWDGRPITRIRGGDDNLILYGRRFSTHLMTQEVVLRSLLKNDMLIGQGLIARCLIVFPLSNSGERPYNPIDICKDPLIQNFYSRASALLDMPMPLASPDSQNELAPRKLELSAEAKARWVKFHDEIDRALKPEGRFISVRRTANKSAEQALRIAGVLTLFEDIDAQCIGVEVIERAILLIQFYLEEALRIVEMGFSDPELELAEQVLEWMKRKGSGDQSRSFSLREIYQKAGPRGVRTKHMAQKIMGILEEHKIVERVDREKLEWRLIK